MHFDVQSKILAPVHFCQIMHHYSQKIVAIKNAFVFTFISFVCIGKTQKKSEKKKKLNLLFLHRTPKMDFTHVMLL